MIDDDALTRLSSISLAPQYRTGERDLVADFYRPCLLSADRYDRAVGYFRSTVFLLAGDALVSFVRRGGRIRVICSPDLSQEDAEALLRGYTERAAVLARSMTLEIERMMASLELKASTETLAELITVGAMQVKLAFRPVAHGIFHEKLGLFHSSHASIPTGGEDVVSFVGSLNETWSAWSAEANHESFEVFRSWVPADADRVRRHQIYFEKLWRGDVRGVDVVDIPDECRELLEEIRTGRGDAQRTSMPSSPARVLMPHQQTALETWYGAGRRGILQHATGSGKTLTAIEAIKRHLSDGPALVLVPSELLLNQWQTEVAREIPESVQLPCSSEHPIWRRLGRLESFLSPRSGLAPRVTIATLQTASSPDFLRRVPSDRSKLLIVCDEVHRAGSEKFSRVFDLDAPFRLGLSATPDRYGDAAGTDRLHDYFGAVLQPPFTLADAIEAGRLVPYTYTPLPVPLSDAELARWQDLTKQLLREISGSKWEVGAPMSDRMRMLLIRRARIAKQATAKIEIASNVIASFFRDGQSWLVYCDDQTQLRSVRRALDERHIPTSEYHSSMLGDRSQDLAWFRRNGGVMVSIRCLDEGIDIPEVSHALIMASSQNPREFIQRRGRVLRASTARLKATAAIYDLLVMPSDGATGMAAALGRVEIARALEFARHALNRSAEPAILKMAIDAGYSQEQLIDFGFEDDEALDEIAG